MLLGMSPRRRSLERWLEEALKEKIGTEQKLRNESNIICMGKLRGAGRRL